MSIEQYQRTVNALDKDIADLEKKKAALDKKAAEEQRKAANITINKNALNNLVSKQFERASILLGKVLFARCPKKPTIIY